VARDRRRQEHQPDSLQRRGRLLDRGVDSIYTYDGTALAVIRKLGIGPDRIRDIGARGSVVVVATNNGPSMYDAAKQFWRGSSLGFPPSCWTQTDPDR